MAPPGEQDGSGVGVNRKGGLTESREDIFGLTDIFCHNDVCWFGSVVDAENR